jgi:hypothetical protein
MEFHETARGARFYDGQVPQLVNNLERIAVALEKLVKDDPPLVALYPKRQEKKKSAGDSVTRPPIKVRRLHD